MFIMQRVPIYYNTKSVWPKASLTAW